ncbi:hypothetical protein [Herbiconiux sp.]|uniref:hypothetical protein n=1 Tax=Herbiconiux sp. TaxID=1871186 RepID=UPI0025C39A6B|nr:hypothetical protein [Herbiconiux sp.]
MSASAQLAFDFDDLTRPPYEGPELRYYSEPLDPDLLDAIEHEQRRVHGNFGIAVGKPHLWLALGQGPSFGPDGHMLLEYRADLRCHHHRGEDCLCLGGLVQRGYCSCGWVSPIVTYGVVRRAWDASHGRTECWACKGTRYMSAKVYIGNVLQPASECWVCRDFNAVAAFVETVVAA